MKYALLLVMLAACAPPATALSPSDVDKITQYRADLKACRMKGAAMQSYAAYNECADEVDRKAHRGNP